MNSPRLLELSGIGDGNLLKKPGIDVVQDNPHVGENLQNHVYMGVVFEVRDDVDVTTLDPFFRGDPWLSAPRWRNTRQRGLGLSAAAAFSQHCLNLRVCDGSIVPIGPRANTQAVVYGVPEMGARLIKESLWSSKNRSCYFALVQEAVWICNLLALFACNFACDQCKQSVQYNCSLLDWKKPSSSPSLPLTLYFRPPQSFLIQQLNQLSRLWLDELANLNPVLEQQKRRHRLDVEFVAETREDIDVDFTKIDNILIFLVVGHSAVIP